MDHDSTTTTTALLSKLRNLKEKLSNTNTAEGMSFLQVKNNLLLSYATLNTFYACLKNHQANINDHPVFKELVRNRLVLERMRPIDRKIKYQVDKLISSASNTGSVSSTFAAPKPTELVSKLQDEKLADTTNTGGGNVYKAPRIASVPYEEETAEARKAAKDAEKTSKRLKKSTLLSELREEFSERPTELLASGSTSLMSKGIQEADKQKLEYEEARFVRLVTSRKDKIARREAERDALKLDSVTHIDSLSGVENALGIEKKERILKRRNVIGSKVGGIFSHVSLPTESQERKGRRASNYAPSVKKQKPQQQAVVSVSSKQVGQVKKKQKVSFADRFK